MTLAGSRGAPAMARVTAYRNENGMILIHWGPGMDHRTVTIYVGDSPSGIDRRSPVATVNGTSNVKIPALNPGMRHYFEVVPEGAPGIMVVERGVPVRGAVNFRDLGGYETADGRRLKWDQVYRSGTLSKLEDSDLSLLKRLGVKLVCDFRTAHEMQIAPDRLPTDGSIDYLHLPTFLGDRDPIAALNENRGNGIEKMARDFKAYMIQAYTVSIYKQARTWGRVIEHLARSENRPMVFHCTTGKDRTGVFAALLLLALGVTEESIIEDYVATNFFLARDLEQASGHIRDLGMDPERMSPYFYVKEVYMSSLIDHIRQTFGSVANYFQSEAGVPETALSLLKEELLE
jgi:protein-tyrosine phosphatase